MGAENTDLRGLVGEDGEESASSKLEENAKKKIEAVDQVFSTHFAINEQKGCVYM